MNYQPTVDNDLQKAIDDITKTTDADPIFSDPVAAPTPMPTPTPTSMPEMPVEPSFTETAYASEEITSAPTTSPVMPEMPVAPMAMPEMPAMPEAPMPTPEIAPAPEAPEAPAKPVAPFLETANLDKNQVKEAALRELAPIADKLDIPASRKFEIYKNVIDNYKDTSVLEPAYRAASDIADEHERAEALLYIIDSIDNM